METRRKIKFHSETRFATDITFQQSNCLADNISKNEKYFSRKNHLYDIKTEVSVFAHKIAIGRRSPYSRFVSDIEIFRVRFNCRKRMTEKMMALKRNWRMLAVFNIKFQIIEPF